MENNQIIIIESIEQMESFMSVEEPFILYFSAPDCSVCLSVFPQLMELVNSYPIKVGKINIKEQRKISGQLLIFTIPTILVFYEGKEVLRESRFIDFNNIKMTLEWIYRIYK